MESAVSKTSLKAKFFKRLSKPQTDYAVFLCLSDDYGKIPTVLVRNKKECVLTVCGNALPAVPGVVTEFFGNWKTGKYGLYFEALSFRFVPPSGERGMVSFLKSRAFPGVGEKSAEAIVKMFGKDTLNVIRNSPQKLITVPGMTPKKVGLIAESFQSCESYGETASFLSSFGIGFDLALRVQEKMKGNALEIIKANPYSLLGVRGFGFHLCDCVARGLHADLSSSFRIRAGILESLKKHTAQSGDTFVKASLLRDETLSLLNEGIQSADVSEPLFRKEAKALLSDGKIKVRNRTDVFLSEMDKAEDLSARILISLLEKEVDVSGLEIEGAVGSFVSQMERPLSQRQAEGVKMALGSRVSVITGGPGTGKTTILTSLISCYQTLFHQKVLLLAPTGKAAKRMSESTGCEAFTIHSRIGLYGDGKKRETEPIHDCLVVVDETSMVDSLLLFHLLESFSGNGIHLLFLGDVNQLQSIGAGAVLWDLIASQVIPVTRLTEIFRQQKDGNIAENAERINKGDTDLRFGDDFRFIPADSEKEALEILKKVYQEETQEFGGENVALLTPLRKNQGGRLTAVSENLNPILRETQNPKETGKDFCIFFGNEYRVGDRILQWKNTEKSSNGDIGTILSIREENGETQVEVAWENKNRTFETRLSMEDMSLAYAMSIHKSQGAEYDSVILPILSSQKCRLFRRNLLYTGVTRAKRRVTIVGDKKAVDFCIGNCETEKRKTHFAERLWEKYHELGEKQNGNDGI